MSAARPNKDEIFNTAAELPDDEQRQAYLAEVCEGDADLRREIEELLEQDRAAGSFLESPPTGLDVTVSSPILAKPGTQIGPYQLLERIGHGGMGVVYLAEQTQPVRRRVALKIIKPGMDTQQVIRRFEAERQALALMDHPNIARVLDAGETESGRPYFVMEWVKGVPITQYCDEHQLTPRERLEIFAAVCQAVQHSHQKGIIHRDIKPSNVLVSESDGRPVAKVIDFGLAKAMGAQLMDRTVFTQQGQIVGTVEYMSPEQADLNPVDVDTRTDIYSLGVLLYELLTGETPFDPTRLRSAAFNEILRIIREEEPPKPSLKLSSSEAIASIAANRHCEPKKLGTIVRGELDWIVMKALEKDRSRRYETANEFANDIQRYLSDESVEACPPSAGYRFKKFARRNKAVLAAAAAILICLLAGITGTTWQAIRATRAEATAFAERDDKELARREAETNAKRAREAAESERLAKEAESHQRRLATAASEQEKQQRKEAERLRLVAEEKELLARRNLYAAHMNLAQQALEKGHTTRVHRLLERHVPIPEEPDWRQFEWYYLLGECHRNQWEIPASTLSNAAFSPNDREIAVPNRSNIEIWDLSTQQRIQVLEGDPQQYLYALAFSPDGTQLVSGAAHRQDEASDCVVWDTQSWQQVRKLPGIEHAVPFIAFSPDGKLIALGDGGHYDHKEIPSTIRLYEAKTGEPVGEFVGHTRMVTSLAFEPNGKRLASTEVGERDDLGALRIWDIQTGQEVNKGSLRGARVDWSPNGRLLATASPHAIWDADTGEMIHELLIKDGNQPVALGIAFSPDGKQLAFAMRRDNSVQVWDVDTGDRIAVLKGHANWVWRVAYSPDSRWLASTGWDGTVKLWDADFGDDDLLPGGEAPWEVKHARGRNHIAVSADGSILAAARDLTQVAILDLHSLETQTTLDAGATIRAVSLSSDGKFLAVGTESSLQLWDVAKRQKTQHKNGAVNSLCFSSTGKELFVAAGKRVDVVEIDRLRTVRVVSLPESPFVHMVCASPDGRHLAMIAPNFQGKVYVWDLTAKALRATFEVSRWTTNLAFSPDGRKLAASGGSWFDARSAGVTKLWDMQSLQEISTLKAHDGLHTALAFSPDGKSLVTASDSAELTIWDLETLEERITFAWGTHPIDCLIFSKDGQTLISGNSHEAVKLWKSASTRDVLACEQAASLAIVSRYLQAGDWERVASVSTKLIELEDQPNLRQMRGEAYAELGRWEEASDELSQIAEMYPLDHRLWDQLALTQLAAGDHQGHEKTVATMLTNHQSSSNPTAVEQAAWAAVLQPTRETDWRAALRSGLSVAESQADPRLADVAVGTALYRGARFQNAVEWMTELSGEESINNEFSPVYGWFILAMAHHQLGQYQQAQHWFGEARRRCQEELDGQEVVPWNRRFTLNWLQEEAELTLQQPVAETTERSIPIALDQGDGNELHNQFCSALYRRRARRLAAENHWKESAESIRKIPKLQNIDSALLIKVARALVDQNEGRDAAALLSKATQFTSNSLEQWTELIELTERVGDADRLQAVYKQKAAEHAITALELKSIHFAIREQCKRCVESLRDAIVRDETKDVESCYLVSIGLSRLGQPGAALAYWELADELAASSNPDQVIASDDTTWQWREKARMLLQDYIDAEGNVAIPDLDVEDPEATQAEFLVQRADAYRQMGKYQSAIDQCTRVLEGRPTPDQQHDLLVSRAHAHRASGQAALADADLSQAIEIKPNEALTYVLHAEVYTELGNDAKAVDACDRASALEPDNYIVALVRAQVFLMSDRIEDYQRACTEMLERFVHSSEPGGVWHTARACVLAAGATQDPRLPIELTEQVMSGHPVRQDWRIYTQGMAHLRAGQLDQAEKVFRECLDACPPWTRVLNQLGLALLEQNRGNEERGRSWLAEAIASMEQNPLPATQDRMEAVLLRREVERLLETKRENETTETERKE